MNDIGLLCVNAGESYNSPVNIGSDFKGYLAESYVAMELSSKNYSLYYYRRNTSEIDFLVEDTFGNVIPIEVKYSINTKSKPLTEYVKRYNPKYSIRISSKNFAFDNNIKSIPLYAAHLINKL